MRRHLDSKRCASKRGSIKVMKVFCDWDWSIHPQSEVLMRGKSHRSTVFNPRKPFTEAEEDLIFKLHSLLGNRWALIAGRLPDRTENEVKKYWNSYLKTKLRKNSDMPNDKQKTSSCETLTLDEAQIADACSGLEKDSSLTRDLNLDLSMSLSFSSHLLNMKNTVKVNTLDHSPNVEIEDTDDGTLLLFQ